MGLTPMMGLVVEDMHHDQVQGLGDLDALGRDVGEIVFEKAVSARERRVGKACRSRWSP